MQCGGKTKRLLGAEKYLHTWNAVSEVLGKFGILRTGREYQPCRTFPLGSAVEHGIVRSKLRGSRQKKPWSSEMIHSSLRMNTLLWGVKGIYFSVLRSSDRNVIDHTAAKQPELQTITFLNFLPFKWCLIYKRNCVLFIHHSLFKDFTNTNTHADNLWKCP